MKAGLKKVYSKFVLANISR